MWASIISAALSIALTLLKWSQERQLLKAGEDAAMAKMALDILESTKAGKDLRDRIRQLSDAESDKLWDDMTNV